MWRNQKVLWALSSIVGHISFIHQLLNRLPKFIETPGMLLNFFVNFLTLSLLIHFILVVFNGKVFFNLSCALGLNVDIQWCGDVTSMGIFYGPWWNPGRFQVKINTFWGASSEIHDIEKPMRILLVKSKWPPQHPGCKSIFLKKPILDKTCCKKNVYYCLIKAIWMIISFTITPQGLGLTLNFMLW